MLDSTTQGKLPRKAFLGKLAGITAVATGAMVAGNTANASTAKPERAQNFSSRESARPVLKQDPRSVARPAAR